MKKIEIIQELKKRLQENFGDIFERVVLYGSQATGLATPESDFDILIVIDGKVDWQLENQIMGTCYELDLKYDILTDIRVISKKDLLTIRGKQPSLVGALEQGVMA